ncbi:hypothetical protein FD754_020421 [Muntiacus muntjak]|uniref:POU domain protein n=1 Tax=Muntiacus muntjak TaxID=9888 RepID=A0A5N3V2Z0_MUNMU|nr:hypothetical protein FD754_020421 [Muntiacus muntjak]
MWAQQLQFMGLLAPLHVESSWTRDRTHESGSSLRQSQARNLLPPLPVKSKTLDPGINYVPSPARGNVGTENGIIYKLRLQAAKRLVGNCKEDAGLFLRGGAPLCPPCWWQPGDIWKSEHLGMFSPSAQALSPRGFLSPSRAHPLPLSFFSRSIIGTIPLMPNPGPSSQTASGTQGLQVQPITPQLLTNAQGQIIATVIGNQILPVINTQGITLSPIKPGQQLHQPSQTSVGQAASQSSLLHLAHSQASMSQSPVRQASSSSSSSSSSSALSVGQLVSNPQTAAGEVDGVNLEEIREFAKAFKIRRLSLGLTQTQVGQALSATEGPAYSQSAICRHTILRSHFFLPQEAQENTIASSLTAKLNPGLLYPARFEKLDITPKSAQKIKPVLERWMAEAEARHRAGMQNLTEFIGSEPSKKRKRRTSFTPQALEILNAHFEKNTHPSGQEMTEIAEKLNYDREVVRVWFCNKRQALKNTIKRLKQHEPATAVPLEPLTDSLEENS